MSRTVTVTLTLPDKIVERLEQTASASHRTLDELIAERLLTQAELVEEELAEIDAELAPLANYSDALLWDVVNQSLSPEQQARYSTLTDKMESSLPFSRAEEQEYQALNNLMMDYLLRRSESLALLKERGQDVSQFIRQPT